MSGFANAILGGAETLIRTAIKSAGYVVGVAGWRIAKSGSAEFNDAVIRGALSAGGGNVLLNSSGLNIHSSVTGRQFDINANAGFLARLFPDDGQSLAQLVVVPSTGGEMLLNSIPSASGIPLQNAYIRAEASDIGVTDVIPILRIKGLNIAGEPIPTIIMSGGNTTAGSLLSDIELQTDTTTLFGLLLSGKYGGVDVGLGFIDSEGTNSPSAAIGNTETVTLTFPSRSWKANRAYALTVTGTGQVSVANSRPAFRLRKTNTAGQQLCGASYPGLINATTNYYIGWNDVFCVGGSDVTAALVMTAQGSAGFTVTVSSANNYSASIEDIGDAAKVNGFAPILV